jgi:hypothetical protein
VGVVHADGRRHRPCIGLSLGDAGARLNIGVERNGNGGQDADDGHHDHQFDQSEATLVSENLSFLFPERCHRLFSRSICGLTEAHLEKCCISEAIKLHPGCQGLPVRKALIS